MSEVPQGVEDEARPCEYDSTRARPAFENELHEIACGIKSWGFS